MITRIAFAFLSVFCLTGISRAAGTYTQCKYGTFSQVNVTSAGSTQLLAANGGRKCLLVVNKGSDTIYVTIATSAGATEGIPIPAGGNWEPFIPVIDAIHARAASGTQAVFFAQGN